jgi:hypothetical protein
VSLFCVASRLEKLGHEKRLRAYIVNYADDLLICCRAKAADALVTMRDMMTKLKLTLNEKKTRVCKLPEEKFDFLGYTFGRCYSPKTGRAYLGTTPSKKRVQRICQVLAKRLDEAKLTGRRADSRTAQPANHRMGQLLLLGPCQPSLSSSGRTHSPKASPVAAC